MNTPETKLAFTLASFFKVFSDVTRIRIILLLKSAPHTVSEIAEALHMDQSAISHQLRTLYNARIVTYVRFGKMRRYEIVDNHIYTIIDQTIDHVKE